MQATSGLQRTSSRSMTGALLFVFAAAVLLLGAAAGYWARGFAPTGAGHAVVTQPATISAVSNSAKTNEQHRQRLVDANNYDSTLPAAPAPKVTAPQHS